MLRKWHHLSIQTLIASVYSIAIVLMISVIGILSFFITSRTVDENTDEYVTQLVSQINYDLEYYLRNIENSLETIKRNEDVYRFFIDDMDLDEGMLADELGNYLFSRIDAVNVYLIRSDGEILVNDNPNGIKDHMLERWRKVKQISQTDNMFISNAHIQDILAGQYKWVISCYMTIEDETTGAYLGAAVIDLNFSLIDDMLNNVTLGEKGYMFIMDETGDIIYHPKHELIFSGIKSEDIEVILNDEAGKRTVEDNRSKNYIVSTSDYSGWKVVGAVYEDELNPYDQITKQIYTILIGLSLVVAILISAIISRRFLRPIKDLNEGMYAFKHGNLDTIVDIPEKNEFGELADSFNDMTRRIKKLVETNKQSERAKRRFELKSLQAQINPHFLYNTLDSIVWMAEAEMNDAVVEMTDSLAKLFRISINRGSEFVTLAQELEHIQSYLKIQKFRYGDKLSYQINSDEGLLGYRVVKIIIQPIVENAIYHGIKQSSNQGLIDIKVKDQGEDIVITIEDNGVGMEQETVDRLLNTNAHHATSKGGIGVLNVDQRIKLYYGQEYGVTITSEVFEGTKVTLRVPKVISKEGINHEKE